LQARHKFRFPLPEVVKVCSTTARSNCRMADVPREAKGGVTITDDFAPVNLYDEPDTPTPKRKR
jgi:hypothetical protein